MRMMWFWAIWIAAIAATFAFAEGFAIQHGTTTLSRFVWDVTAAWPPLPFIAGFLAGFLCCHFWWGGIVSFKPVKKSSPQQ
jgi:hypothetical protein